MSSVFVAVADLQVMLPLLYNFVGSSKKEKTETEQVTGLVVSRPSSHLVIKEVLPGSEENVRRFILQFQCKSEGKHFLKRGPATISLRFFYS